MSAKGDPDHAGLRVKRLFDTAGRTSYDGSMATPNIPSINNVRRIVEVAEQIEKLHAELVSLVVGSAPAISAAKAAMPAPPPKGGAKTISAETRKRMAAAQRARFAKARAMASSAPAAARPAPKSKKKRNLTPEGRARLSALMKARWEAKAKATRTNKAKG